MERRTENTKVSAEAALHILEEAWAYYTPLPLPAEAEHVADQEELFHYHNAA
ncbi:MULTISPECIES: hypothetical protein [Pseudodonghicola]|jgi:hypothetical protein|uniref:Uncharacterized protein n=1 Tax=Pseudodonghicola xiamenensis TaxID=337702 RepID=A0A8J3MD72_9RHOB|nr:hypothetical protein [Pseudodonghicola xiamenensis]GHG88688.1 hypothetical protein GCM10010961_17940 [Pseudodonghicola xiamenensis]